MDDAERPHDLRGRICGDDLTEIMQFGCDPRCPVRALRLAVNTENRDLQVRSPPPAKQDAAEAFYPHRRRIRAPLDRRDVEHSEGNYMSDLFGRGRCA